MTERVLPPTVRDYWPQFAAAMSARKDRKLLGLETGFATIDAKLSGLGGVTVLAGAPGAGKTTLVLQVAWQVSHLNRVPALYVSAEMFREPLMTKLVSRLAEAPYRAVALGALWAKEEGRERLEQAKKAVESVGQRFVLLDRRDRTGVRAIVRHVRRLKEQEEAERALVVVDSLQNLALLNSKDGERGTTKEILDRTMTDLYRAAHADGFDVLLVSHIPKAAKGRIEQFVFSGSGGIDFEADCTMLLSGLDESRAERDTIAALSGAHGPDTHDVRLTVLKHRFCLPCAIDLVFHPAISSFREP